MRQSPAQEGSDSEGLRLSAGPMAKGQGAELERESTHLWRARKDGGSKEAAGAGLYWVFGHEG